MYLMPGKEHIDISFNNSLVKNNYIKKEIPSPLYLQLLSSHNLITSS